jgi:RNA polymerase sigma factor (sigma-70 family)
MLSPSARIYTEPELVAALKQQESDAFQHLYMHYKGALYAVILQTVPDAELASDVLQEVFVTIWRHIDKYDPAKGKLFTWLHTIARNQSINTLKSRQFKDNKQNVTLSDLVYNGEHGETYQLDINQIGLRKQVALLKDEFREVVDLAYFKGLTREEISHALNLPVGTVKTRLRNALIELRKQFG